MAQAERTVVNVSTEQLLAKIGALTLENDGLHQRIAQLQSANADLSGALATKQGAAIDAPPTAPAAD